jgi:hypothetical protein
LRRIIRTIANLLIGGVLLSALPADAAKPGQCKALLSIAEVATAMGRDVRIQPVFANGGLKGWRLYQSGASKHLVALGISPGSLMTHLCGVPAREIFANQGDACCPVDVSREFEVTIEVGGAGTKVLIKRPSMARSGGNTK